MAGDDSYGESPADASETGLERDNSLQDSVVHVLNFGAAGIFAGLAVSIAKNAVVGALALGIGGAAIYGGGTFVVETLVNLYEGNDMGSAFGRIVSGMELATVQGAADGASLGTILGASGGVFEIGSDLYNGGDGATHRVVWGATLGGLLGGLIEIIDTEKMKCHLGFVEC